MINFLLLFISNIILIKSEKTFHHFTIHVDYNIIIRSTIAGRKISLLKESLNTTVQMINSILLVKSGGKIEQLSNNVCNEKIPFLNESLLNGVNADFLLFPYIEKKKKKFMTHKICIRTDNSLRPIVGYIKINERLFDYKIHNQDNLSLLFLYHLTRLIGLNLKDMNTISSLRKNNNTLFFNDNNIYFKESKLLNELIFKRDNNEFMEFEKFNNEFFLNENLPFNDYMKLNENNFFENNLISPFTFSLLNSLNWYYVKLPYLKIDYFTMTYNLKAYIIKNNNLNQINYCYGDIFTSKYKNKDKCDFSNREFETEIVIGKFPELKDIESQNILLINPLNKICKNPQKTIFFKYIPHYNYEQNIKTSLSLINIKLKEFMFINTQDFSTRNYSPLCLRKNLELSNSIRTYNKNEGNLLWYNPAHKKRHPNILFPYEKYNHFFNHSQMTRKDLLYKNFKRMNQNFPNDYNFMSETLQSPLDKELINKKFHNYIPTKDNLWLIKPQGSTRGKGIKFLEDSRDIHNYQIVTKYISNPHLINGKKYDLRIYLFVTGHRPLKIYIYDEGLARICSEEYNLDITNLKNLYIHLTNVAINKKNPHFKKNDISNEEETNIWSLTKLKEYYKKEGKDFDKVFKKIQDIAIKSVIGISKTEIETEDFKTEYTINNENLFELYGMDILIDENMNAWLIEINLSPSLGAVGYYEEKLKSKLFTDMFNILGFKLFSHVDYEPLEMGIKYNNFVDENVNEALCEFERETGGFIRVFPRKNNIEYYKPFFQGFICEENSKLWEIMEKNDDF